MTNINTFLLFIAVILAVVLLVGLVFYCLWLHEHRKFLNRQREKREIWETWNKEEQK